MGSIRNLGAIDLTPQPCGHVGPHERTTDRYGETTGWFGFPANGQPEPCAHWVTNLSPYRRRDHRTPASRWWLDCSCGFDWHDVDEAACLAMFASHVDAETRLAAQYLPADTDKPWRDS